MSAFLFLYETYLQFQTNNDLMSTLVHLWQHRTALFSAACTGAHITAQYSSTGHSTLLWSSVARRLSDTPEPESGSEIMTPQWGNTQGNKILDQLLYTSECVTYPVIINSAREADVWCVMLSEAVLQAGWYCCSSSQTRHFHFIPPAPAGVWHHQHFIDFL